MKSRINQGNSDDKRARRRGRHMLPEGNGVKFSNTVDINGDPNETFYNTSAFSFDQTKKGNVNAVLKIRYSNNIT